MWRSWLAAVAFWVGLLLVEGSGAASAVGLGLLLAGVALLGAGARGRRSRPPEEPSVAGKEQAADPRERILEAAGFLDRRRTAAARRSGALTAAVVAGFVLLGSGWGLLRSPQVESFVAPSSPFVGTAASDPRTYDHGWGLEARLRPRASASSFRAWLFGRGSPPRLQAGERIRVEGSARPAPAGDGFGEHLRRRGVVAEVSVTELEVLGPARNPAMRIANAVRSALTRGARAVFPRREAGLLLGLTIGDTSRMDPEIEEDFRATGLGHLVAVSGSNVAMVLAPVLGLASLVRARLGARLLVGSLAVGLFALVTRWEPSVLRASVMASLAMLGIAAGRPRETGRILGVAVLLLLAADPRLATSLGFRLSVAATAGILALSPRVAARLRRLPAPVALAVAATVGAQVAVTPFLLHAFGVVPGVALLANVLAAPAVAPAFLGGAAASAAGLAWEPLGDALGTVSRLPIAYLAEVADRSARLPAPSLVGFGWVGPALLLGGAVAGVIAVPRTRRARRRTATLLIVPLLVWLAALRGGPPSELTMVFFDVGQGDAALVRTPEGAVILVDAGPDEQAVATKLAAIGVGRIDLVIASHAHADHLDGLPAVLARHPVDLLLEPGCPADSPSYARLLESVRAEGVPTRAPRGGEQLRLGRLEVQVLGPDECATDSPNDDSIVIRLVYGPATVLFPGDAETPAQNDLLHDGDPVRSLVLKVPHHGSATSDPAFLEAVGATIAVVSVGQNDYGHPVTEILDALRASGARVLRTDLAGDVTVRIGAEGLHVESASA